MRTGKLVENATYDEFISTGTAHIVVKSGNVTDGCMKTIKTSGFFVLLVGRSIFSIYTFQVLLANGNK